MKNKPIPYSSLKNEKKCLREMLPLSMPISMFLDPSNYCNFRCLFCPRSLPEYRRYVEKYVHFDLVLFEKIMKEITTYGRLKVLKLHYLGEPFLHPQIIEMISLAAKYNAAERFEITSNGSVLSNKHAEGICSIAKNMDVPLYLRFSIYSVYPERHLRITNSKINIEKIYQNIEYLKKCRDNSGVKNVFIFAQMLDTYTEENDIFRKRYGNITDEVIIVPPTNWSGFDEIDILSNVYGATHPQPDTAQSHKKVCALPFYTLCINSDGTAVACCVDWSRKTLLGNVKEQTIYEIWNGSLANELRKLHLRGERAKNEACRHCEYLNSYVGDNLDSLSVEEWDELNKNIVNLKQGT